MQNFLREAYERLKGKNGVTVNIYGVVMGFTSPHQTKRGDWMSTVSLVDDTMTGGDSSPPVTLVAFCKDIQDLPDIHQMGDVLRMHRVSLEVRIPCSKRE